MTHETQSQGRFPFDEDRNYNNVLHCASTTYTDHPDRSVHIGGTNENT